SPACMTIYYSLLVFIFYKDKTISCTSYISEQTESCSIVDSVCFLFFKIFTFAFNLNHRFLQCLLLQSYNIRLLTGFQQNRWIVERLVAGPALYEKVILSIIVHIAHFSIVS